MKKLDYLPFGKPDFNGGEIGAVERILKTGWVGMGPETIAFEEELAEYFKCHSVVTVSSCTAALTLALKVSDVAEGDEVICPSLTWCSTANAVIYNQGIPVFCDINPTTMSASTDTILEKITERTKAVIVVHYGGLALDVKKLKQRLPRSIVVIEDAAHALGAKYPDGNPVGSAGNLTCFSFYANKNLATGEGGAIAVPSQELDNELRSLRLHGLAVDAWKRFSHPNSLLSGEIYKLGYKMNYTDLQAAIGRVQLKRQGEFFAKRLELAEYYRDTLSEFDNLSFQDSMLEPRHARHLVVALLPIESMSISRNDFIIKLREKMIGASIHYAPLHLMSFYATHYRCTSLPATERIYERTITLPISSSMTLDDAYSVVEQFSNLLKTSVI
jgi:perosamine synthetase